MMMDITLLIVFIIDALEVLTMVKTKKTIMNKMSMQKMLMKMPKMLKTKAKLLVVVLGHLQTNQTDLSRRETGKVWIKEASFSRTDTHSNSWNITRLAPKTTHYTFIIQDSRIN